VFDVVGKVDRAVRENLPKGHHKGRETQQNAPNASQCRPTYRIAREQRKSGPPAPVPDFAMALAAFGHYDYERQAVK
jgi:hypothetical protein